MNLLLWLTSTGILILVFKLHYINHINPCILCLLECIPWIGLWLIMTTSIIWEKLKLINTRLYAKLCTLSSILLAFYHIGIHRHWWHAHCQVFHKTVSMQQLTRELHNNFNNLSPCEKITFHFFGLSLPENNFLISLAIFFMLLVWPQKK